MTTGSSLGNDTGSVFALRVLYIKIVLTLVLWAIPLLTFPLQVFALIGMPMPWPDVFCRLLGAAYLSLCAGYASGISLLKRGGDASGILRMGIASNGLASLLITVYGIAGSYAGWSALGQAYLWFSAFATFCLAVSLGYFLLRQGKLTPRG